MSDARGQGKNAGRGFEGQGRVRYGGRARVSDASRRSAQRPSQRSRHGDKARSVAFQAMRAIEEGAYANLDLPARLRRATLHRQDYAFVTELVYGTTRMRGFYDAVISVAGNRRVEDVDADVLAALRLGVHQILDMRVPVHAAVDETVALVRGEVGVGASKFANAVLRRVSERSREQWCERVVEGVDDEAERLAVLYSHPAWVVRALRAALVAHGSVPGADAGDEAGGREAVRQALVELLEADNAGAKVALVARPGLADVQELVEAGAKPLSLSAYSVVLDGGDPGRIAAVRSGRAAVQDPGSVLLPPALVGVPVEPVAGGDGERWLDMCAGPGGKAGLLAALSIGYPGDVAVFANEVSEHRAELVEQAVSAAQDAGAEVFVGVGDGRSLGAEEPGGFDRVLVDAPCTGLGALRRRPEARWRRVPRDVAELAQLQGQLLDSAIAATRVGGVVAYVTCSPHPVETVDVVQGALERNAHVSVLDAQQWVRGADGEQVQGLGAAPYVQLWPHVHGTDAMFLALLRVGDAAG
ncbi:RsmB/NOP family class I SAM-dependent RNA methyltransferase [Dermatophilus congolensis]|uniref:Ribosomal RNA small subunit methyltransferase B n=1 Tax=Dermatophilus congolensis TaxID=1863 RepID=A0A239VHB0_9MICO|nr:transcription antitermination factor NusB [Dermatophilus congolensis]MBO3129025.1 rRNA small subunit methyltransferase B [Dermatophilus congolensis]MBO3132338.1 rRNA small subunit methyltransferase B [Dermatophilus congolensis]MBO3133501.1 rRNA small subunit methyltransferase B [Dermatophilus congolensis]MBO3135735.1 rRNA small subunit methyltransferase B [Dermatophilus congolensis]MBO3137974.1 rRNA small subunit methyltransferase B [Dermatophilus congolensis]